jgi:crossover junction endodeoxyribonuclease RusA
MRLVLPYPPSANRLWQNARGHMIKSAEAKVYGYLVLAAAQAAGIEPFTGAVSVKIDVYRPRKAGDLDNRLKVAMDSLNGLAWHDDGQIVEIHARRFDDKTNPRIEVEVTAA